jgi:transcriptional regulator with XRE-family HTH domain
LDHGQRDIPNGKSKIEWLHEISHIRSAFAVVLKSRRLSKQWSQVELGGLCGLDNSYISQLEKGLKTPTLDAMLRISKALGILPETLMKEVRLELGKLIE